MTQIAVKGQIWNYWGIWEGSHGRPQGSPLLVLHGWGRSGNEWINMAKELSSWSGRRVYVIDLPGFGGSSLPKVTSLGEYIDLVIQFCHYLKISKVVILCHSLGARVGIMWASGKHKEMVEKLILVDPAGPKEFSLKRTVLSVLSAIFRFVPEKIRRSVITPFLDEDYRRTPELRRLYRVVVAEDLYDKLSQIKIPVKLIWGEQDKIVPIRMVKVYRRYLPDVKVRIVWGANHDPHLTKYEQTLTILQEAVE